MNLKDFIENTKIRHTCFAKNLHISPFKMRKILAGNGGDIITLKLALLIEKETYGAVTVKDLLNEVKECEAR